MVKSIDHSGTGRSFQIPLCTLSSPYILMVSECHHENLLCHHGFAVAIQYTNLGVVGKGIHLLISWTWIYIYIYIFGIPSLSMSYGATYLDVCRTSGISQRSPDKLSPVYRAKQL